MKIFNYKQRKKISVYLDIFSNLNSIKKLKNFTKQPCI